jgi:hypothetical protein
VSSSIALANRRPSASPDTDEQGELEGPPVVFLCDEPEAGLHRAAEHRLAHGLSRISRIVGGATLVATHSPDLLASQLVRAVFVTRNHDGGVVLRPVPLSIVDGLSARSSAAQLGLSSADLWALGKVTVVVEGIHDVWVFKALLRDDLDAAAAAILPMHGGTRLRSLAEARLVVDGSDAQVLVVLDDLVAAEAAEALADVKRSLSDPEQLRAALEQIRAKGKQNDSFLFLHQFALRAAELGTIERVWVHGLSLPDVICYLDPDTVLLDGASWPELISRWTDEAAPAAPKNIKGWLRRRKLLPDDPREVDLAVERAVLQMREESRGLHGDLVELGLRVRELAAATVMDGR